MAKYPYIVKHNGEWYRAGEEVPVIEDMAVDESPLSYSDDDIELETKKDKTYTKTEINRMSKAELLEMAKRTGVEGADEMTGADLKEYLLSVFGL